MAHWKRVSLTVCGHSVPFYTFQLLAVALRLFLIQTYSLKLHTETGGLVGDEYVNQGLSTLTLLYTNSGYYLWQSVFISHPKFCNTSAMAVSFLM